MPSAMQWTASFSFIFLCLRNLIDLPLKSVLFVVLCMHYFFSNIGVSFWGKQKSGQQPSYRGLGCLALLLPYSLAYIPLFHIAALLPNVDRRNAGVIQYEEKG